MSDNELARINTPINEIETMAGYMVTSGLFGIKTKDQAVALMLISQAEGLHPALAARDYHIIQGRHTLKADAMLARFQQSGGKVEWVEYTDKIVAALFSHPQSPRQVEVDWTMERAKQAGLGGKDNWKKYPRQMLKARVVSDGVRLCFPGAAVGVYTPEEVQDFEPIIEPIVEPVKVVSKKPVVTPPRPKEVRSQEVPTQYEPQPEQTGGEVVRLISEKQRKRIFAILTKSEKNEPELKEYLLTLGLGSTKDIPCFLYEQIVDWVEGK